MAFKGSSVNRWRPLTCSLPDVMFFIMDCARLCCKLPITTLDKWCLDMTMSFTSAVYISQKLEMSNNEKFPFF